MAGAELSGDFYTTKWYCVTCYPLDTVDDLESIAGYKKLFKKGRVGDAAHTAALTSGVLLGRALSLLHIMAKMATLVC